MASSFHLTVFFDQFAIMENKGRAFNAHDFLAIHILFFNDIKVFAQYFFFIADQIDSQILFFSKVLVRFNGIT